MENLKLQLFTSPSPPLPTVLHSTLPNDLLYRILGLLSLRTLFRLRSVCRLWRSLPFSLLFVDFHSSSSPYSSALLLPDVHHLWFLAFRLLARKVNERHGLIAYDREMLDSCGHVLPPTDKSLEMLRASEHAPQTHSTYEILNASCPLLTHFDTGILDIAASADGLLLLTVRLKESQNYENSNFGALMAHDDSNLRLFVYNPISKDIRALPAPRWGSQKLSMVICEAEGDLKYGYKIYSLARHYNPGTTNLRYSFQVYDSRHAAKRWQYLSLVSASLILTGEDLLPGKATQIMGYVNSKAIYCKELGFLYWMHCLDEYRAHTQFWSCHPNTGCFYRLPRFPFKTTFSHVCPHTSCLQRFPFKTTFSHVCPHTSCLQLVCGVPKEDDLSVTRAVEIWELHQRPQQADDEYYIGARGPPARARWQPIDKLPDDLWECLTHGLRRRIECAIASPLIFVIAEEEEEEMVVYNVNDRVWKLQPSWGILHQLFRDKHPDPDYYQVFPWIISFTPNQSTLA